MLITYRSFQSVTQSNAKEKLKFFCSNWLHRVFLVSHCINAFYPHFVCAHLGKIDIAVEAHMNTISSSSVAHVKPGIHLQVASHSIFTLLPSCLPCSTHTRTHLHTHAHTEYCCQAGRNYQRCALTCPTTFPRNHGNPEIARACVMCFACL